MKKHLPILIALVLEMLPLRGLGGFAYAQGSDPTLAGLIELYKTQATKMYKAQSTVQALEATNHIWLNSETKAICDLQKEFDDYISAFRGVVVYAAQIYGFYYEIDNLVDNMNTMTRQIGDAPTNAFAVALSARRNDIYTDIIRTTTGIINNVRMVCMDKKMTEKDRVELIFDVRPRLQKLNIQLRRLNKLCKYTNLTDVWREIIGRRHVRTDKSDIIRQSFSDWRGNGRKITP